MDLFEQIGKNSKIYAESYIFVRLEVAPQPDLHLFRLSRFRGGLLGVPFQLLGLVLALLLGWEVAFFMFHCSRNSCWLPLQAVPPFESKELEIKSNPVPAGIQISVWLEHWLLPHFFHLFETSQD
jgi:hypothetical protein